MKLLPLSNGQYAQVDDIDFMACLGLMPWSVSTGYAIRYIGGGRKAAKYLRLHHFIASRMGLDCSNLIDHRDRNRLNNQRDNLRLATTLENARNISTKSHNTSGAQGVEVLLSGKCRAKIVVGYKQIRLGTFDSIEDAKAAYLEARKHYFGEFA